MYKLRTIIIVLFIFIAFGAIVRSYRNSQDQALTTTNPASEFTIYLITMDKVDQFWHTLDDGASTMAKYLGVNYIWEAPQVRSIAGQVELIYEAVENGSDLIMLAALDSIALSTAIEDAKALSVKFIYVDSPAEEEALLTLSTDNLNAGMVAAETMINELESVGIRTGSVGVIAVDTITPTTIARERGFRNIIEEDGRFNLINTVYTNGSPILSEAAADTLIEENSDLVGLFGVNEGTSEGVGQSIIKNNISLIGIGFDRSDTILQLIRKGGLDVVISQNPFTMGYLGMAEAYAALQGLETGPAYLNTGISILRRQH